MFKVLPIKVLREEDKGEFSERLIRLARLSHHGLPVLDGLAVAAPIAEVKEILKGLETSQKIQFETTKERFKEKLFSLTMPEELNSVLKEKRVEKGVWGEFLERWYREIESKIHREEDLEKLKLTPQSVFFTEEILGSGKAYLDPQTKEVNVTVSQGELDFEQGIILDGLILKAQRMLHLPYIYSFVLTSEGFKFVDVVEFTGKESFKSERKSDVINVSNRPVREVKRAVKIFLNIDEGFATQEGIDGFVVSVSDKENFDTKVFKFSETALSNLHLPVVLKFSDIDLSDQLSYRDQLKEESEVFLFARNKKRLLNTQIMLPKTYSLDQFLQIKRDLSSLGIIRKGTLKIWMKVTTAQNLLEIADYLGSGVDGVLIDFDKLSSSVSGQGEEFKGDDKLREVLLNFIEEPLKIIKKVGLPVLASGKLNEELLEGLIKLGIYGVVLGNNEMDKKELLEIKELEVFSQSLN